MIGRTRSHWVTILGVLVSTIASSAVFDDVMARQHLQRRRSTPGRSVGGLKIEVGFLIDSLTATMMVVVTFVSLMVHVYTIGYMADDPGYQRFFSYISLFTFSMLMLVMSNNFLQLFFGWEAVGLVSYLLIGFWYKRPTAIYANLKAFLVNRVGDFGFVLGIGLVLRLLRHAATTPRCSRRRRRWPRRPCTFLPGTEWLLMTVICVCLFIGAMGKSAQFPLHVWLPDSMEGPTPISALIHAATMVTAGIFMVARMSPLFELSDAALSFVIVIGAITALFMGFLGIVQNDIKRVVAYSTLSQLGYMTVALGASATRRAIFHLMTHAFFKALLFLAAGSVIIGMHHDQDIRHMGGLRRYMPVTWITSLIGSLALIGTPFFSGFYSKDAIILAVEASREGRPCRARRSRTGSLLVGVFVTAFYSFRMYFLVFHGKERCGRAARRARRPRRRRQPRATTTTGRPRRAARVAGGGDGAAGAAGDPVGGDRLRRHRRMLFGDFFRGAIFVDAAKHPAMKLNSRRTSTARREMALHALHDRAVLARRSPASALAWYCYLRRPDIPAAISQARFARPVPAAATTSTTSTASTRSCSPAARAASARGLWKGGDMALIDGVAVNGSARLVGWVAAAIAPPAVRLHLHYAIA